MTDQGSEGLLSPFLRKQRIKAVSPYLRGKVLDYGCGSGRLAALVEKDCYLGLEQDTASLQKARAVFPEHRFIPGTEEISEQFDTIVLLAVIEHVHSPVSLLQQLASCLDDGRGFPPRLVLTTPHPFAGWIHDMGSAVGLFSKHASEEHETLLDRSGLETIGRRAGLQLIFYKRFLFALNQLAVFQKEV